ncbi:hypothetical protein N7456_006878 [Penicillium angulare]|uniref:Uncharacterized protein n=1 Tax=Penicillium angulare TaxID=116970 RepID=A0A9W9FII1_9EURO|nr:hypothetical protein N7456_006878 [Penicillium angulare]
MPEQDRWLARGNASTRFIFCRQPNTNSSQNARVSVVSVSRRGAAPEIARVYALTRPSEAASPSLNEFES